MYCSGSESSHVEHFRPLVPFPAEAMTWENLLWACSICNSFKGDRFPLPPAGGPIVNPTVESVWDFFFIDKFGNLSPRWRPDLDALDPGATKTIETLRLDREALQIARLHRLRELIGMVEDSLALHRDGQLTRANLQQRRDAWLAAPFHPDVADYFLMGPGRSEAPFAEFLLEIGQI